MRIQRKFFHKIFNIICHRSIFAVVPKYKFRIIRIWSKY